jgi:parvulin-like peptidyl-prolyl isomerase
MAEIIIGNEIITPTELSSRLALYQMLPQLQREIIIDRAIAGIEITPDEQEAAINQFYQQKQINTSSARDAFLQHKCINQTQLKATLTRQRRIDKFKQITWPGENLEQYFLKCKQGLDKVTFSLLCTQDMEVAEELYHRIKAGEETFAECAKKYSIGTEAETGGLQESVSINQLHPVIAEMLSTSQPGQLWPPRKLGSSIVIIRLEKLISAQLDEVTKNILLNSLFEQWLGEQIKQNPISIRERNDG